jgi:carbon-monoxide dehydrogenase medium subunit
VRIGALTTLDEIDDKAGICASYPVLTEAIASVADPQIRNRATLGGSLFPDRAGGDIATALLALGASVNAAGPNGERTISIDTLLGGSGSGRLGPADIVTSIDLPVGAPGGAYEKVRNPASGFAICGVAALLRVDFGVVSHCRVAVTGTSAGATRLLGLEAKLLGEPATLATVTSEMIAAEVETLTFAGEWPASAEYRAHLARVLAMRAVRRAAERTTSAASV